jgi:hypothetical protein
MDLFDVARSCARRWYVFLPLLLLAAWFSYSAYTSVKPVYYSSAVLGISPPPTEVDHVDAGVARPRNGLLDIGGASLIANLTSVGLRDPSVAERVVAGGGLPHYITEMFPTPPTSQQLPLVWIEVTDPDPAAVTKTLELLIAQSDITLQSVQQNARVPKDQMVTSFVVSPPSPPAMGMPTRMRSTIAILVAGVGLSVLITVVLDVLLTTIKARRRQRLAPAEAGAHPEPSGASPNGEHPSPAGTAPDDVLEPR